MTEEEIEEQSEEYATEDLPDGYTKINYTKKLIYIDGAKWGMEHAIEWHDLRKDPYDLPNDNRDVINERGMLVWCKDGVWYESNTVMKIRTYPTHWCELPTYKE